MPRPIEPLNTVCTARLASRGARSWVALGWVALAWGAGGGASAQVPGAILPGISVEVADVLQMPDTRTTVAEDSRVDANFARINFLQEVPGDAAGRWMVNDLRGQLYMVDPRTGVSTQYTNFNGQFPRFIIGPSGLSTGLLVATPHPQFLQAGSPGYGKFYTIHEERANGNPATPDFIAVGNAGNIVNGQHGVVTEWTSSNPAANVFNGTRRELLRVAQPSGNLHNLGDIEFNPHAQPGDADFGMMYISGGDGGYDDSNKGDLQAQQGLSIFGKVLRIDPLGSNSANGKYGIPADNPFLAGSDPTNSTLDEVYALGFRNAHRIGWDLDPANPTLYLSDIGKSRVEEVNILHAGGNYGWSEREGTFETLQFGNVGPLPGNDASFGYTYPVAQYDHGDGFAIAGGFVYRGSSIPALYGKFVYGDIVNGRLFYSDAAELRAADDSDPLTTADIYELTLTQNGSPVTLTSLILGKMGLATLPANRHDLRVGQTSDGEIYLITKQDAMIRRLVATPGDYDGDGQVTLADYAVWRDTLGDDVIAGAGADGDRDGVIGEGDYTAWVGAFGAPGAGAASAQAPEPAAATLLLLTALAATHRHRGRGR